MKAVGYRQIWSYLDDDFNLDEAILKAQAATRQLAKRQITWLKSKNDITYINSSTDAKLVQKTYFDFK